MTQISDLKLELAGFLKSQRRAYPSGIPISMLQAIENTTVSNQILIPKSIERLAFRSKIPLSKLILGQGSKNPAVMFVRYKLDFDSSIAEPNIFSGKGGELLSAAIVKGLKLPLELVYVTSIFKGIEALNVTDQFVHDLSQEKIAVYKAALFEEIEAVMPQLIVLLGSELAQICGFESNAKPGEMLGIPTITTLDPTEVAKNQSLKRTFWEDLKSVSKIVI